MAGGTMDVGWHKCMNGSSKHFRWLTQKSISLNLSAQTSPTTVALRTSPMLVEMLPALAQELQQLLIEQDEPGLAAQVPGLRIVDRCRCGDDFCSMFYVLPKPNGAYGPDHRNVALTPTK